jgi:hypothetical protein
MLLYPGLPSEEVARASPGPLQGEGDPAALSWLTRRPMAGLRATIRSPSQRSFNGVALLLLVAVLLLSLFEGEKDA